MNLTKIISGGQAGVDRGGLEAAIQLGLEHGGWCPKGRKAEDGEIPRRYQLAETKSSDYPERTRKNVMDSDATLLVTKAGKLGRGSTLTVELCGGYKKPHLIVTPGTDPAVIRGFLAQHGVKVLNVAGSRASTWPDGFKATVQLLKAALTPQRP